MKQNILKLLKIGCFLAMVVFNLFTISMLTDDFLVVLFSQGTVIDLDEVLFKWSHYYWPYVILESVILPMQWYGLYYACSLFSQNVKRAFTWQFIVMLPGLMALASWVLSKF